MKSLKKFQSIVILTALYSLPFLAVSAASGEAIEFSGLNSVLKSIVKTIQYYTIPIMAISLAFLGIKLVMSGDNTTTKNEVKQTMTRVVIGGFIIFGATTIADTLSKAFL